MSREAIPQLHHEAQANLADITPELATEIGSKILRLSNLELYQAYHPGLVDGLYNLGEPVQAANLTSDHQTHIERINALHSTTSGYVREAHQRLKPESAEASADSLLDMAADMALANASLAMESETPSPGEVERHLENFIAITLIQSATINSRQISEIVSKGLTVPYVKALEKNIGLISVPLHGSNPVGFEANGSLGMNISPTLRIAYDAAVGGQSAAKLDDELLMKLPFREVGALLDLSERTGNHALREQITALSDPDHRVKKGPGEFMPIPDLSPESARRKIFDDTFYAQHRELIDKIMEAAPLGADQGKIASLVIEHELMAIYQENVESQGRSGNRLPKINAVKTPEIGLEDLPLLKYMFKELGFDDNPSGEQNTASATDIFDSWMSYDSIKYAQLKLLDKKQNRWRMGSKRKPASHYGVMDTASALTDQKDTLMREADAFFGYESHVNNAGDIGYYSIDKRGETKYVVETFGIHHFSRYKAPQLHSQAKSWGLRPSRAIDNVVVSAQTDWNGAFFRAGSQIELPEHQETVFFETGSSRDLASMAITIGKRERDFQKREPNIKRVVLLAHANSKSLVLGQGNELSIADYDEAEKNRRKLSKISNNQPKLNTYERHLGPKFEVILYACDAAKERKILPTKNTIAGRIQKGHAINTLHGAAIKPTGLVITEDSTRYVKGGSSIPPVTYRK